MERFIPDVREKDLCRKFCAHRSRGPDPRSHADGGPPGRSREACAPDLLGEGGLPRVSVDH